METLELHDRIITGQFVNGLAHGFIYVLYKNLDNNVVHPYYAGMALNGKAHGHGRFEYGDGTYYEGEFENDKFNGKGVYVFTDGTVYVGEFYENQRHGYGVLTMVSGETYEGEFEYDKYSGHAKHTLGNWTYVGQYYKDLKHGYGEMVNNKTGEFYKGYFLDGYQHGYGMASWCGNEKTAIKGQWANGRYLFREFIPSTNTPSNTNKKILTQNVQI